MSESVLDVGQLTREEQLDLLDRLWDALGRDPEAFPLSDAQHKELDRRLDELDREGPTGLSRDEAVAQIRSRAR